MAVLRLPAATNFLSGPALSFCLPALGIGYTRRLDGHSCRPVCRVGSRIHSTKTRRHRTSHHRIPAQVEWNKWREMKLKKQYSQGLLQVYANSKADDSLPPGMSMEKALMLLGVAKGASFEDILKAKNSLLARNNEDQEFAIQVEAAYDLILMHNLMQRRAGKVVNNSILFADVKKSKNNLQSLSEKGALKWLNDISSKFPVVMVTPPPNVLGTQTAVYAALMAWMYTSGMSSIGEAPSSAHTDVSGLNLAIGFGVTLYFLRKQNVKLGKAAAIAISALAAGAILGGVVESWLRVDIIPVFGIGSPAVVVSEFALISLWFSSLCLR
eukprot:c25429_g1_i1 orf=392-1369(+)